MAWSTKKKVVVGIIIALLLIFVVIPFIGGFFLGFFDATYEAGYNQAVMDSGGYYDDGYNEDLEDFFDQGYVDSWDP